MGRVSLVWLAKGCQYDYSHSPDCRSKSYYNIISEYNINENKDEELFDSIEYNLLYFHSFDLIKFLNNKGLKFKFTNEILRGLFETKNFNRSNDTEINNTIILDLIKQLAEIDLFKIDLDTIHLFLCNYKTIKIIQK